jgi:GT2 family glycosyltransferase
MTQSLPAASLVIASRNRPAFLAATVESVLRGDDVPAEVVVVDQSDERNAPLAELERDGDHRLRYLWTSRRGASSARNAGIAASRFDIVAFADDDMLATPLWFGSLVRALLHGGVRAVVTGQVRPAEAEVAHAFVPSTKVDEATAVYRGRLTEDVLYTGNMAMYRSVADAVGLFDERLGPGTAFPSAEDNDFGFRLLEAGYRIVYVPEALLYHRAWRSERDYVRLRWTYGVGRGGFYAKHLGLRDRYMLRRMTTDVRRHLRSSVSGVRRERRRAYGDLALATGILVGAVKWLLTKRGG